MLTVPRIRRGISAALVSLALAATVLIPMGGVASAASTSTTCPTGEGSSPVCILVISGPDSVVTGVPFTVQVLVTTDGTTVANSDPCASKVAVTLDVSPDFESPFFSSSTVNASAGIATFSVTIPGGSANDGTYDLFAHVGGVDLAPTTGCGSYFYQSDTRTITAVTIPDTQPIAPCPDNTVCRQIASGGGTAATLIAEDGFFDPVFFGPDPGLAGACGGGPLDPGGVLTFDNTTATSPKTIIFALASSLVTKGIGQFNVCWSSPVAFVPLGGGAPVTTGLLPACGKNATGPCVLFKKSNQKNVGFFGVLAPPGGGDPSGYTK